MTNTSVPNTAESQFARASVRTSGTREKQFCPQAVPESWNKQVPLVVYAAMMQTWSLPWPTQFIICLLFASSVHWAPPEDSGQCDSSPPPPGTREAQGEAVLGASGVGISRGPI